NTGRRHQGRADPGDSGRGEEPEEPAAAAISAATDPVTGRRGQGFFQQLSGEQFRGLPENERGIRPTFSRLSGDERQRAATMGATNPRRGGDERTLGHE